MKINKEEVKTKTVVTLSGSDLLELIEHGVAADENVTVQIPEKEWLPVIAELGE